MPDNNLIQNIADITRKHLDKFCKREGFILDTCEMRAGLVYFKIKFKLMKDGSKCPSLMPGEYVSIEKEEEIKNVNISEIFKLIRAIQKDFTGK